MAGGIPVSGVDFVKGCLLFFYPLGIQCVKSRVNVAFNLKLAENL